MGTREIFTLGHWQVAQCVYRREVRDLVFHQALNRRLRRGDWQLDSGVGTGVIIAAASRCYPRTSDRGHTQTGNGLNCTGISLQAFTLIAIFPPPQITRPTPLICLFSIRNPSCFWRPFTRVIGIASR
jgi:hypothetical protein